MKTIFALLLLAPLCVVAQSDGGTKAVFHVRSVSYADNPQRCPTDACTAKRYSVEGYVSGARGKRIEYTLTCDEVTAMNPHPRVQFACPDVHANNDYNVTIYPFGIDFWKSPPANDAEPYESIYEVVSEREVSPGTRR